MEKHMTGRTDVDRLPVVDRIPAGPRVRLKCGGPAERQRALVKKGM